MLTRLCLIRHGETDWNVEHRVQGSIDIPLNARGRQQAQAAAETLFSDAQQNAFAAIYCSDLRRAHETASIIASRLNLPAITDAHLRERNYGGLQGLTADEAEQRLPGVHPRNRGTRDPALVPPGGESLQDFARTVQTGFTAIAQRHPGQSVLVVSHGGVLDVAYRLATAMPLGAARDFTLANAALNWIGFDSAETNKDKAWQLLAWDQRAHLESSRDELRI
ncbi:MAG TPA: histidine phosphatase family protein [Rhodocyclaceae bacterium]|nr:histidine phosphatase family protein [Rhodocyclaceae bacterium]